MSLALLQAEIVRSTLYCDFLVTVYSAYANKALAFENLHMMTWEACHRLSTFCRPAPPTSPAQPRPAGAPRILEALSSRQQGLVPSISRRKDLGFQECQKPVPLLLCGSASGRRLLQQLRGDGSAWGLCGAKKEKYLKYFI